MQLGIALVEGLLEQCSKRLRLVCTAMDPHQHAHDMATQTYGLAYGTENTALNVCFDLQKQSVDASMSSVSGEAIRP